MLKFSNVAYWNKHNKVLVAYLTEILNLYRWLLTTKPIKYER